MNREWRAGGKQTRREERISVFAGVALLCSGAIFHLSYRKLHLFVCWQCFFLPSMNTVINPQLLVCYTHVIHISVYTGKHSQTCLNVCPLSLTHRHMRAHTYTNRLNACDKAYTDCAHVFMWDDPRTSAHVHRGAWIKDGGMDGLEDGWIRKGRRCIDGWSDVWILDAAGSWKWMKKMGGSKTH